MNKFIYLFLIASICCGDINKVVAYLIKCPKAMEASLSSKCVANALQAGVSHSLDKLLLKFIELMEY